MTDKNHCTSGDCQTCRHAADDQDCRLKSNLSRIQHKIVVMSGKGGVGKSTVAVNLAMALTLAGKKVGLLDVDLHGPSVPKMLHLEGSPMLTENDRLLPVAVGDLSVMSVGFMLKNPDDAVIWRGPMKIGVIKQFLADVAWGDLDFLIVDVPPGTGDEPLSVCQMLGGDGGDAQALIVTTPQAVAAADVAKSLNFCRQLHFKVLGIVENMSGFACPKCGEVTAIFAAGAGETLARQYEVPLLGRLPIDPVICRGGDNGEPFIRCYAQTATARAFETILAPVLKL